MRTRPQAAIRAIGKLKGHEQVMKEGATRGRPPKGGTAVRKHCREGDPGRVIRDRRLQEGLGGWPSLKQHHCAHFTQEIFLHICPLYSVLISSLTRVSTFMTGICMLLVK
ncbi:hypothetical protein GOP47_0013009 [Adiantum capillus-veneris]|uniref:Uncharacterized protein n=1 Tax=Adiantum capillus-veneris TaxID=13818 RepID=A0A9D4UT54_ADICA|nr:hypothetical protein GOP47_0013009 [Adiantum capillus-veneris]